MGVTLIVGDNHEVVKVIELVLQGVSRSSWLCVSRAGTVLGSTAARRPTPGVLEVDPDPQSS